MVDPKDKVFKYIAFEPSDEEVAKGVRMRRQAKRTATQVKRKQKRAVVDLDGEDDIEVMDVKLVKSKPKAGALPDLSDDSDDDLPDTSTFFAAGPVPKSSQTVSPETSCPLLYMQTTPW